MTDRCNLRCAYCAPAEGPSPRSEGPLLPLECLADIVAWLARQVPLQKIRLTGGEPTLRPGLAGFVRRLAVVSRAPEITMTTNGARLAHVVRELAAAGLARVNVSLDTLDSGDYRRLTRGGDVRAVLAGIRAARAAGLGPVKLNSVLRRSSWKRDLPALLDFALAHGVEVRFLELMRTGTEGAWAEAELITAAEVMGGFPGLEVLSPPVAVGTAPARVARVLWRGRLLAVGWITPASDPFCDACSRLRLDPRGRLRRCLMDPTVLDLRPVLDGEAAAMGARLRSFIAGKQAPDLMATRLPMVSLGG